MNNTNTLPPIIDREILFGNPEITGAQLSPDGTFISFIKPYKGVMNIWVKHILEDFDKAIPVTADMNRPVRSYFWSRDSRFILYAQDKGGDENFHIYAVNPEADPEVETGVPSCTDLTPYDNIAAFIVSVPRSSEDRIYVGLNNRDKSWHDLYSINIHTGENQVVFENKSQINGYYFNLRDELAAFTRSATDGGTEILIREGEDLKVIYACTVNEMCHPVRFAENGAIYLVTNKGPLDLTALGLLNPETGEWRQIDSDPEDEVDFGQATFSELTDTLIATSYVGDKTRIYWKDNAFEQDYMLLKRSFPKSEISITSMTKDEQKWIFYSDLDTDPGAAYLFDRTSKDIRFQYRPRPQLVSAHLAEMIPVKYPSSDGLEIPAYLTLPKGLAAENLPAVIVPHGGPWARDYWGYNSFAQFLANRGYAVLAPNFRGSIGFGKKFINAGNRQWGEKMQDDLTWGVKYLVENGYADPAKVAIMGGSYGGYAALAGLTFTPEVYSAGISIVGPSNLFTLLETIPPYWETARKMFHERMGNPETEEGRRQLRRQSPLFHVENIKSPLLIAQGANDPRVKKSESDQIVEAMQKARLPVEYLVFPDEGHGFANPDNNMAFLTVAEKFLSKHLGGRYQEEVPEHIESIINSIQVQSTLEKPTL